jgi:hypothetical protein
MCCQLDSREAVGEHSPARIPMCSEPAGIPKTARQRAPSQPQLPQASAPSRHVITVPPAWNFSQMAATGFILNPANGFARSGLAPYMGQWSATPDPCRARPNGNFARKPRTDKKWIEVHQ